MHFERLIMPLQFEVLEGWTSLPEFLYPQHPSQCLVPSGHIMNVC